MILVDTDVLIDFLRGYPRAAIWFESLGDTPILLCTTNDHFLRGPRRFWSAPWGERPRLRAGNPAGLCAAGFLPSHKPVGKPAANLEVHPTAHTYSLGLETPLVAAKPRCGLSALELLEGCRNKEETDRLLRLLAPYRIVWPGARDFDRVLADFAVARLDRRIGILDVLIGETAVGLGLPLHTFNVRHFRAIPGLQVVEPYLRSK